MRRPSYGPVENFHTSSRVDTLIPNLRQELEGWLEDVEPIQLNGKNIFNFMS